MNYDVAPTLGMNPEIGLLFAALVDSRREWLGELGEPTEDALVWQASPEGHSIGGCLLHLIGCEQFWFGEVANGLQLDELQPANLYDASLNQNEGKWPIPERKPFEWYKKLLDESLQQCEQYLMNLTDPKAAYTLRDDELTLRWIVAHVVQHDAYTGGQAVLLHETWLKLQAG